MVNKIKNVLKRLPILQAVNARIKAHQLGAKDREIANSYEKRAARDRIVYSEQAALDRLALRVGRSRENRRPRILWIGADQNQDRSGFLQALSRYADVSIFHNSRGGYGLLPSWDGSVRAYDPKVAADNGQCLIKMHDAFSARGVAPDFVLGQMWAQLISVNALEVVRERGAVVVNIAMDDRLPEHWLSNKGVRMGSVGLAPGMDLVLTTAPEACLRYEVEGCVSLFVPLGSDSDIFGSNQNGTRFRDVVFVGNNYGIRGEIVRSLIRAGISVEAYGAGWPLGSVRSDRAGLLFGEAKIVLGIGTIGHCMDKYTIKLRDFDGPMSGALYLTHRNPDLSRFYDVGREIVCYKDPQECVAQVKLYLANDRLREGIAAAGFRRVQSYSWDRWVQNLLSACGWGAI